MSNISTNRIDLVIIDHQKRVTALEETQKQIQKVILFELFNNTERFKVKERIEALESKFKQLTDILCSDDYASIISELNEFKKQLEGK